MAQIFNLKMQMLLDIARLGSRRRAVVSEITAELVKHTQSEVVEVRVRPLAWEWAIHGEVLNNHTTVERVNLLGNLRVRSLASRHGPADGRLSKRVVVFANLHLKRPLARFNSARKRIARRTQFDSKRASQGIQVWVSWVVRCDFWNPLCHIPLCGPRPP